ncbi:ABC transporter ATP-binding protein [Microbacterium kribbense]|uniref:ABC transporter ATP-binding protein n=1 Tax=Microbacterium kribbense TaxID=433645 RepID=A0ABP7GXF0_9MICO
MATVTIRSLRKVYDGHVAVDNIDLTIGEGEFVTLLGPSGCGKTTTLRCVAGLEKPDGGEIEIAGRVVSSAKRNVDPNRRGLGMVFQSYSLWPHMTVFGNVAYPLRMRRESRHVIAPRVRAALEMVGLERLAKRSVGALSGGQQQRVALARALVSEPQLLLFDEPLSNLDAQLRASMRSELHELHRRIATTSIYVTHDQLEALTLSDRIVVMNQGSIQQIGTPHEIYSKPANSFVARFLGFENVVAATLSTADGNHVARLRGFDGTVVVTTPRDVATAGEVDIAIRANAITLCPPGQGDGDATVSDAAYLGDENEYRIRLDDGSELVARAPFINDHAIARPGDRVGILVAPGTAVAFPREIATLAAA